MENEKIIPVWGVTRSQLIKELDEARGGNKDPNLSPEKVIAIYAERIGKDIIVSLDGKDKIILPNGKEQRAISPSNLLKCARIFQNLGVPPYSNYAYLCDSKGRPGFSVSYLASEYLLLKEHEGAIIKSDIVFENDEIEWVSMPQTKVHHKRNIINPGQPVAVYASLTTKDDICFAEIVLWDEILRAKEGKKDDKKKSPWLTFPHEMARKFALKRLFKKLKSHAPHLEEDEPYEEETKDTNYIDSISSL